MIADGTKYGIREWVRTWCEFSMPWVLKAWIVGNSLGGWLAFQFAIDYPKRLLGIVSMRTGGAKLTGALVGHSKPDLSVAGTRKTLELFVLDNSLVTDELVSLPYEAALNDTAPNRLADVVAARDRDRTELPRTGHYSDVSTAPECCLPRKPKILGKADFPNAGLCLAQLWGPRRNPHSHL